MFALLEAIGAFFGLLSALCTRSPKTTKDDDETCSHDTLISVHGVDACKWCGRYVD